MRFVFFWYSDPFKNKFWENEEAIFFDSGGWWIKTKNNRINISIEEYYEEKKFHSNFDVAKVIAQLRELMPVWSRWNGKGDQYELMLREAAFQIGKISGSLECLGPGVAIFHTGVSHWMDTIICELACRTAQWKQVFLYKEIISDRLLPLIQSNSINDRKVIQTQISDFKYKKSINEFIANLNKGNPPVQNDEIVQNGKSFFHSLIYITLIPLIKSILRPIKNTLLNKPDHNSVTDIFYNYQKDYLFQNQNQMIQQYIALNFYKRNAKKLSELKLKNSSINLILASHYQPEATTFPEGYKYGNHVDIVIKLRNLGYVEKIFYKEHSGSEMYRWPIGPTRVGMYRSKKYYEQLLFLNCIFINMDDSLFNKDDSFINLLPVTITGTIAIERSLMGLHTIITGEPWYKGLPGTIHISKIKSLKQIPKKYLIPDKKLKNKAIVFLEKILNGNTIINTPGIGLIEAKKDQVNIKFFNKEISMLIKSLQKVKL